MPPYTSTREEDYRDILEQGSQSYWFVKTGDHRVTEDHPWSADIPSHPWAALTHGSRKCLPNTSMRWNTRF